MKSFLYSTSESLPPRSSPEYYTSPSEHELRRSSSPSTTSWASDMPSPSTPGTENGTCASDYGDRKIYTQALYESEFDPHSFGPNVISLGGQHHSGQHLHYRERTAAGEDSASECGEYTPETLERSSVESPCEPHYVYQPCTVAEENGLFGMNMRYLHHDVRDCNLSSPSIPPRKSGGNFDEANPMYQARSYSFPPNPISPESPPYPSHTPGETARDAVYTTLQCGVSHGYCEDPGVSEEEDMHLSSGAHFHMLPPSHCNSDSGSPPPITTTGRRRAPKRTQSELPLVVSSNDKPHICKVCERRFRRPEHLRRHSLAHTGEKPYACNVRGCRRRFSRTDNLRAHKRTHTTPGGRNAYVPDMGEI